MIIRCPNPSCPWCRTERDSDARNCPTCGAECAVRPGSLMRSTGTFKRNARESRTMAFQEAGIGEVKADCPSMDFKIRDGEAVPVFHDNAHQRQCYREMKQAGERYKAQARAARAVPRIRAKKPKDAATWQKQRARSRR